jgi:hypothetical protein
MKVFASVLSGETAPPSVTGYFTTTALSLAALQSLETGAEVQLPNVESRDVTVLNDGREPISTGDAD